MVNFVIQVHGINSIKTYMKRILEKAGLQSDDGLSNVSARKYLASTTATTVQPETAIQVLAHIHFMLWDLLQTNKI